MGVQEGQAAIHAFAVANPEMLPGLRHLASNIVVDSDGDGNTATGSAFLLAYNVAEGFQVLASGRYTDQLTKTSGGWRFTDRVFVAD